MKNLLFRKSFLLILYTCVYLYFMAFNWQIFTVVLNINLGFGVVKLPPFIILFLVGFIIIGALSWHSYMTNLQRTISTLEHGHELWRMKDREILNKIQKQILDEQTVNLLINKLGIQDLRSKQDELSRMMAALKTKLE